MRAILTLTVLLTALGGLQAQDTSKTKKNFKIGLEGGYLFSIGYLGFQSHVGLAMTFKDRHVLTIGPDWDIDFDLKFEGRSYPYLRLGYQYKLKQTDKKLKFYLIYESRYNWSNGTVGTLKYIDNAWKYIETELKGVYIDQYAGLGLRRYFWKDLYLSSGAGFGVNIWSQTFTYSYPDLPTEKRKGISPDIFATVGLGYNF